MLGETPSLPVLVNALSAPQQWAAGPCDSPSGRVGKAGQSWTWCQGLSLLSGKDAAGRHLLPPRPFSAFPRLRLWARPCAR